MKRFLPFFGGLFLLAACNTKPAESETKTLQSVNQANAIDTAGLSQFQQWKAQNELTVAAVPETVQEQAPVEQVKTVTVVRERIIERPAPVHRQTTQRAKPPVTVPQQENPEPATSGNGDSEVASNSGTSTSGTSTPAPEPAAEKKEGWSKAAKGAAIGGAGGAVLGAIINKKNPAVGAAIGGVLGGAVGYGIGKKKDNKDGRN